MIHFTPFDLLAYLFFVRSCIFTCLGNFFGGSTCWHHYASLHVAMYDNSRPFTCAVYSAWTGPVLGLEFAVVTWYMTFCMKLVRRRLNPG